MPFPPHLTKFVAHDRLLKIVDLFDLEPGRLKQFTVEACGVTADFSRQRLSAASLAAVLEVAADAGIEVTRGEMFSGKPVNNTEGRAALHTLLRGGGHEDPMLSLTVRNTRGVCRDLALCLIDDPALGGAEPIEAILHLGVGGSDLGPRLLAEALADYRRPNAPLVRFIGNIDGAELDDALAGLNPARTLVTIVSKTFTTLETMSNARVIRDWMDQSIGKAAASKRLIAITAAPKRAVDWGVPAEGVIPFWDWVGGRYSVWSAVSLSVEMTLKPQIFDAFLEGARAMDLHFQSAPMERNLPILAAIVAHWNREALEYGSTATVPYAHRLGLLPAWLQQLEMESNGKRVTIHGRPLAGPSAGVTWGGTGAVAQHSFFQMLHQGVTPIPVDFLLVRQPMGGKPEHHRALLANALAQAQALLLGKDLATVRAEMAAEGLRGTVIDALAPHKVFPGDRPSTIMSLDALTPERVGALLAFYEHRTVVQAWLCNINPFDQWGVELGKAMAKSLDAALVPDAPIPADTDPATAAWIHRLRGDA